MTGRAWIDQLPDELAGQKAIMRRLLEVSEADDRIRWLAIGCSLGRGNADWLSDLDMALGVADGDFDAAIGDVRTAVDGLAGLVESYHHLLPEVTGPHERIFAQYADRCQLDLVVFPASADIGRGPSMVVLYDADDRITVISERPAPDPREVREWAFRGWCALADLGKYLRRGSLWEALERLQEARGVLWKLRAVAGEVPDARYGIVSILDFAPGTVPPEMAGTVAGLDHDGILAAARQLARLLDRIGDDLPGDYRAVLPAAMAEFIIGDLAGTGPAGQSWAPDDCTLPTAERPLRAAEFDDLFAGAVLRADRAGTGRLRLELRPDREVAARAAALAAAETQCCAFFTFTLTVQNESLALDITVPEARADILDALAGHAAAAGGRAMP